MSGQPAQSKTARSGQHPAVQAYRAKLESISNGAASTATSKLDREIDEFLTVLKTPVPPKLDPSHR